MVYLFHLTDSALIESTGENADLTFMQMAKSTGNVYWVDTMAHHNNQLKVWTSISKLFVKSYISVSSIDSIHLDEGNPTMPSCYGAMRPGHEACRTCWDVREAYDNMGWEMKDEKISQCTGK